MTSRFAAALVVALTAAAVSACGAPTAQALTRHVAAPPVTVDPTAPCENQNTDAPPPPPADPPGFAATFDRPSNRILVTGGDGVALSSIARKIDDPAALREVKPGEWLLGANLEIARGASVDITAPAVHWLKLSSVGPDFVTLKAIGGGVTISGSCVTSWDDAAGRTDTEPTDGRSFILARDGAKLAIDHAEIRFLGYSDVESYGLSWRTEGTTGGITDSKVSNNYFGLYSFGVGGLVVRNNEVYNSVLYGIDPHTGSHDMTIEGNIVHDNGKHGIILAENCVNSVIRGNIVYRNQHHGIVLYLNSDKNVIEDNDTFDNAVQGININESSGNAIRGNRIYDNAESGVGVGQTAQDNTLEQNQVRGNKQDGIRLVSEASGTVVHDNTIGENTRYGVYVDSDGQFDVASNLIFGSRTGILLKGTAAAPASTNSVYDNTDADIKNS